VRYIKVVFIILISLASTSCRSALSGALTNTGSVSQKSVSQKVEEQKRTQAEAQKQAEMQAQAEKRAEEKARQEQEAREQAELKKQKEQEAKEQAELAKQKEKEAELERNNARHIARVRDPQYAQACQKARSEYRVYGTIISISKSALNAVEKKAENAHHKHANAARKLAARHDRSSSIKERNALWKQIEEENRQADAALDEFGRMIKSTQKRKDIRASARALIVSGNPIDIKSAASNFKAMFRLRAIESTRNTTQKCVQDMDTGKQECEETASYPWCLDW